jgi:hypothetical protein
MNANTPERTIYQDGNYSLTEFFTDAGELFVGAYSGANMLTAWHCYESASASARLAFQAMDQAKRIARRPYINRTLVRYYGSMR